MYGTQTLELLEQGKIPFENDVKMYGTQTSSGAGAYWDCLRMM